MDDGYTPINFTVPSAGKYYIRLHCGAGYSIDGYKIKLSGSIVGVKDINATLSDFKLYPNPASYSVTIRINDTVNGLTYFNIYNSIGVLVKSGALKQDYKNIHVGNLPNGLYSVAIKCNGSIYTQKLIIQK